MVHFLVQHQGRQLVLLKAWTAMTLLLPERSRKARACAKAREQDDLSASWACTE